MDSAWTRRALLRAGCCSCAGGGIFGWRVSAAADEVPTSRMVRPAVDSVEGGLWALMDREETRLRRSGFLIREPQLQAYLEGIVCKLGGSHCRDVRVYLVQAPAFNALMAPNGMMVVNSGLLLRMENEAQLAAVIGHEIGHFLERHTLENLKAHKGRAAAAVFLSMFGIAGGLVAIGVMASQFNFNREQELQADSAGVEMMRRAGYDAREAAAVWENLLGELRVRGGDDVGRRSPLFATHPPVENRRDALTKLAGSAEGVVGADDYQRSIAAHRLNWMLDEIRRGQFEETLVLLDRMIKLRPADPVTLFARGESRRLRGAVEDIEPALADLRAAAALAAAPADTFRSLGLVHKARAEKELAAEAFLRYLALAPLAGDAGLIKSYLTELQS